MSFVLRKGIIILVCTCPLDLVQVSPSLGLKFRERKFKSFSDPVVFADKIDSLS